MKHVAGYVLHNDYSERVFQLERGGQWVKGKSCDTFAPLGPFIATPDEIGDVHDLQAVAHREREQQAERHDERPGVRRADARQLHQPVHDAAAGRRDLDGHAGGVAMGHTPVRFLQAGDVVELGIDGLGSSRQRLRAYA